MAELPPGLAANPILARWIQPAADGTIAVRVGKVELGQGIVTALAQIAADQLGVDIAAIRMLPAGPDGPDEGLTAGSLSIMNSGSALRVAAANVRELFAAAASSAAVRAATPGTAGTDATTEGTAGAGTVSFSYAEWAGRVDLEVPADPDVPLRAEREFVGADVPRFDLPDKVFGRPRYIQDVRLPGQMFGRVIKPPSRGARLLSVEPALPAGVMLVREGSFLGILAADEAVAVRAAEVVRKAARWAEHDSLPDEDELDKFLRAGPHETITVVDDGEEPPAGARVRATYSRPFIAHASMAPSCGVAVWRAADLVDVWSHSQGIFLLGRAIARELGLAPEGVRVEHAENAGCYGHNAADDAAFDAVLLARAVPGTPVQVLWSRQDELAWAPFGSAMTADVAGTLTADGRLSSWQYDVYSQGHTARPGYAGGVPGLLSATLLDPPADYPAAVDPPAEAGAGSTRNALPGYDLPRRRVTGHRLIESPLRSSAMRALGAHLNVFAIESFMDEAALEAGRDPLDFRLAHLSDPRARQVLESAAEAAGWGRELPEGVGLGLGCARYKGRGAYCAVVAEVEAETEVRLRRLHIAVDVGLVVNPDGVRNQIEGGATQSASWTLVERVRFDRRQVTSDTWETYPILRFSQTPAIEVTVLGSEEKSVGAGEAAQGPTAAAIANAVASAIGVRVRDLPLTTEAIVAAIDRDT
ncbi:xanthine dehydrogenase family protein molybdopterin-binding subunit [Actinoplanes sp. LDG1-06]|uniref:Xanthine dehydrogenase family protein molybdopterin-binding subunit n=1 Tax=Paractinoplanes ovalisporus TaxID=2810368 RepID=A0ABS2A3P8_9ACTN|nr:molybdopterin cofactor-binding domain-containing protein [Actinoplanes ovalisporus]MBM2614476.1 xanthine dehydrogenase family protein molybdopterin-binding subunit [Actinoplanes ovalisporus]